MYVVRTFRSASLAGLTSLRLELRLSTVALAKVEGLHYTQSENAVARSRAGKV